MSDDELIEEIDKLRRTLRSCDTQASAISWMAKAHELMGIAATKIEKAAQPLVYTLPKPYIAVIPSMTLIPVYVAASARQYWDNPAPLVLRAIAATKQTAWTRRDTRKLKAAA